MENTEKSKAHKVKRAGRKAEKKKQKEKHEQVLDPKQRNPKAFAVKSAIKAERRFRRTMDITSKRQRLPTVDRTPLEPPPVVVAIVGPPKVGKTTLIQCLIKNFTRQTMANIQGPVTVVSGKKTRLTFLECNNDINVMIDVAKIADLVLLIVDAKFGFEMETFEFLNICQVHGFPRIMGVLTHLDLFTNSKQLKVTKKQLKHRFWTEIYQGAKMFYLSGMIHNEYQKTEIRNLGRFISVMKFRPVQWRATHPFILADRMEDLTNPEEIRRNAKCDRDICLYGYVRGTIFKNESSVHVPGCGDFTIKDMSFLPDPCPLPDKEKKRALNEKEKSIYAPFSGVGGIVYDKDAVYIDLGGSHSHASIQQISEKSKPSHELVCSLMSTSHTLDTKIAASQLQIFKNAPLISSEDVNFDETLNGSGETPELEEATDRLNLPNEEIVTDPSGRIRRRALGRRNGESNEDNDSGMDLSNDSDNEEQQDVESDTDSEGQDGIVSEDKESDSDDTDSEKEVEGSSEKVKTDSRISDDGDNDDCSTADVDIKETNKCNKNINVVNSSNANEREVKDYSKIKPNSLNTEEILQKIKKWTQDGQSTDYSAVPGKKKVHFSDDLHSDSESSKDNDSNNSSEDELEGINEMQEAVEFDNDEDNEVEKGDGLQWKDNLQKKAATAFYNRQSSTPNLRKLVYGFMYEKQQENQDDENEEEIGGLFVVANKKTQKEQRDKSIMNHEDCSKFTVDQVQDWNLEEVQQKIKDCFVTGKWKASEDAENLLNNNDDDDDEVYSDFEDLETGQVYRGQKEGGEEDEDENDTAMDESNKEPESENKAETKRLDKKRKLKEMFDSEYDEKEGSSYYSDLKAEMDNQTQLNRNEFEDFPDDLRVQYEGYRPGMYIRMNIEKVPCEFVDHFDPSYPVIVGGLLPIEENIGCVQVRFKKHRWHKRILKTRDPLIISLGWRRFQTIPLYSIQDHNGRNRLLKYTPEHMHCVASFWGPITPQNTGLLAIQTLANVTPDFRIAATGVVLDLDKSIQIVKKLKITGVPHKIHKKTAFIKDMFNTTLEVAKFEGASIRTVSGIRGQIKKAVRTPEGAFRATFEDKILMSDIVFLRTWYPIQIPTFYNPVTSLLLPLEMKSQWQGMKTVGQLRKEKGISAPLNLDSLYKPINRLRREFKPLMVPKTLQKDLPYQDKPKMKPKKGKPSLDSQRIAVIREPHEQKVSKLLKMIKVLHDHKQNKERDAMKQRVESHKKAMDKIEEKKLKRQKEIKKEICRVLYRLEQKKMKQQTR